MFLGKNTGYLAVLDFYQKYLYLFIPTVPMVSLRYYKIKYMAPATESLAAEHFLGIYVRCNA